MPITADILAQLKKLQGQPTTSEAPSPFLKIPNSELLSKVTRGNSAGPGLPSDAPMSGLPDAVASAPMEQRQPSVRLGSSSPGVLGNVEARQQATSEGLPSSQIRDGEILPPKQHHGFWDRLKQVGEGAVISMGQQARQNAQTGREQSLESLLGAGAAGGVVGGVSPLTIDAIRNREQGQQDIQALHQQQGLEAGQAQIDALRKKAKLEDPAVERERDDVRGAWQTILNSGQDFSADNPEHVAIHDRAAKLGITLPYGKKAAPPRQLRNAQTGSVSEGGVKYQTQFDPDTNQWVKSVGADGKPIVLEQEKPEPKTTPYQDIEIAQKEQQRQANLKSAQNQLQSLTDAEELARQKKDKLSSDIADLKAKGAPDTTEEQKAVDEAQKEYASYAAKKRDAQAEIDKWNVEPLSRGVQRAYDNQGVLPSSQPKPSKLSGSATSGAGPEGLSRAVFKQNNPQATQGKTPAQIDAMIRGGGFKPIP